jgi:putative transposase
MKPENYYQPLIPENTYHLFSRTVGSEQLFKSEQNYFFFLDKLEQHTDCVCQYYTYSLLPNHFHLLGRIRSALEIEIAFSQAKKTTFDEKVHSLSDFIMERFSNLLNSYSKSFNKVNHRKGSLFIDYLKRSLVKDEGDLSALIWYIHKNAVHHGYTTAMGEWQFDGYHELLSNHPTTMLKNETIEFYGNRQQFIQVHQQPIFLKNVILDFH